jgi:sigma-B regulation protein RsbU (phosphoserine phosphatase)
MEGIRYRKNEIALAPGDAIYLYTDGVTEATDASNELYGEDRLHSILEKYKDAAPQVICEEVKRDVDAFVGEAPQFDDITMLCLEYKANMEKNAEDAHRDNHA